MRVLLCSLLIVCHVFFSLLAFHRFTQRHILSQTNEENEILVCLKRLTHLYINLEVSTKRLFTLQVGAHVTLNDTRDKYVFSDSKWISPVKSDLEEIQDAGTEQAFLTLQLYVNHLSAASSCR